MHKKTRENVNKIVTMVLILLTGIILGVVAFIYFYNDRDVPGVLLAIAAMGMFGFGIMYALHNIREIDDAN